MNIRFDDSAQSKESNTRDVIQCPKCHFDTRAPRDKNPKLEKLTNGDAVGAYNIARRGLMIQKKIRVDENPWIILKEWDKYTHKNV
jgi:hypothetical protein